MRHTAAFLLACAAAACTHDTAVAPAPPASARPVPDRLAEVNAVVTVSAIADPRDVLEGLIVDGPRGFVTRPRVVLDGRVVRLRRDDPRLRGNGVAASFVFTRAEVGDRFGPGDYDGVVIIRTAPCEAGQRLGECIGMPIPIRPTPILSIAAESTQ